MVGRVSMSGRWWMLNGVHLLQLAVVLKHKAWGTSTAAVLSAVDFTDFATSLSSKRVGLKSSDVDLATCGNQVIDMRVWMNPVPVSVQLVRRQLLLFLLAPICA